MKFLAFRIKNFRSIIDSGWNDLSADNVTGIIGQNESGKTTILEALFSFYTGEITDDMLRSDLSLPVVTVRFESAGLDLLGQLDRDRIPEGLQEAMTRDRALILSRYWNTDKSSRIVVDGEAVNTLYKKIRDTEQARIEKIDSLINKTLDQTQKLKAVISRLAGERQKYTEEQEDLRVRIADLERKVRKLPKGQQKEKETANLESLQKHLAQAADKLKLKVQQLKEHNEAMDQLIPKTEIAVAVMDTLRKVDLAGQRVAELTREYTELQEIIDYTPNEKEKRGALLQMDMVQEQMLKARGDQKFQKEQLEKKRRTCEKMLREGLDARTSVKETEREFENYKSVFSREELGTEFFQFIPVFELFEDFGSLLPDRIDLDDILTGNQEIEGYKAVRNFLVVSGLDTNFFNKVNNRILKQKIENLNNEITVNFQEYWRQNIGRNNKIRINFELEHYGSFYTGKVGKPYLEFWIRDDFERLYPKQRSRGVRWFLSFYLELKAIAGNNDQRGRILLIDEPGLSLHARAQEDVLKVFDDIKSRLQVIYTTHSPHLIDLNKLYRLLAVQRADLNDERSESVVFSSKSLQEASSDTLSPIYTLMGTRITDQKYLQQKNNVILEDISTYYYLTTFFRLLNIKRNVFFLPATDVTNVMVLVNLLTGWGFEFVVVLDDDECSNQVYQEMKANVFGNSEDMTRRKILRTVGFRSIEDLFSTIDFKKYVLQRREGIPETNSKYIENNGLSRSVLASNFHQRIMDEKISFDRFDEETRENIMNVVERLGMILGEDR